MPTNENLEKQQLELQKIISQLKGKQDELSKAQFDFLQSISEVVDEHIRDMNAHQTSLIFNNNIEAMNFIKVVLQIVLSDKKDDKAQLMDKLSKNYFFDKKNPFLFTETLEKSFQALKRRYQNPENNPAKLQAASPQKALTPSIKQSNSFSRADSAKLKPLDGENNPTETIKPTKLLSNDKNRNILLEKLKAHTTKEENPWITKPKDLESLTETCEQIMVTTSQDKDGALETGFIIKDDGITIHKNTPENKVQESYKKAAKFLGECGFQLLEITAPLNDEPSLLAATKSIIAAGQIPMISPSLGETASCNLQEKIISQLSDEEKATYNAAKNKLTGSQKRIFEQKINENYSHLSQKLNNTQSSEKNAHGSKRQRPANTRRTVERTPSPVKSDKLDLCATSDLKTSSYGLNSTRESLIRDGCAASIEEGMVLLEQNAKNDETKVEAYLYIDDLQQGQITVDVPENKNKIYCLLTPGKGSPYSSCTSSLQNTVQLHVQASIKNLQETKHQLPVTIVYTFGMNNDHAGTFAVRINSLKDISKNELLITNSMPDGGANNPSGGYHDWHKAVFNGVHVGMGGTINKEPAPDTRAITTGIADNKYQQVGNSCFYIAVAMARAISSDEDKSLMNQYESLQDHMGSLCGPENEKLLREDAIKLLKHEDNPQLDKMKSPQELHDRPFSQMSP